MIKITRKNKFEAAHYLPLTPEGHKCRNMHGHSYKVIVEIIGDTNGKGWIVDTAQIDNAFKCIHAMLDHKVLNDVEGLENPTTEILAVWLWKKFNVTFGDLRNVYRIGVVVEEGENSTASYNGDNSSYT